MIWTQWQLYLTFASAALAAAILPEDFATCSRGALMTEARLRFVREGGPAEVIDVPVKDLATTNGSAGCAFAIQSPVAPSTQLNERGFVVLPGNPVRTGELAKALEGLQHQPHGLATLGYSYFLCGEPVLQHVMHGGRVLPLDMDGDDGTPSPPPSLARLDVGSLAVLNQKSWLRKALLRARSGIMVLKVWLPQQVPVQPLALLDAQTWDPSAAEMSLPYRPSQRWWWHSDLDPGSWIVLDALRVPHASFAAPSEAAIADSRAALRQLLVPLASGDGESGPTVMLRDVVQACKGLPERVLVPDPYPALGERYVVDALPTTLLRRHESVESDVMAEIPPGGFVTILRVGQEGPDRVQIYTEHGIPLALQSINDDPNAADMAMDADTGLTGWITSAHYNGTRILRPAFGPVMRQAPTAVLAALLKDIGDTLGGVCSWANTTLEIVETRSPLYAQHSVEIFQRHKEAFEELLSRTRRVSGHMHCLAVAAPPSIWVVTAFAGIGVIILGFVTLMWLGG